MEIEVLERQGALEKMEQNISAAASVQENGSLLQEERKNETGQEGGWVREKHKNWEHKVINIHFKKGG